MDLVQRGTVPGIPCLPRRGQVNFKGLSHEIMKGRMDRFKDSLHTYKGAGKCTGVIASENKGLKVHKRENFLGSDLNFVLL